MLILGSLVCEWVLWLLCLSLLTMLILGSLVCEWVLWPAVFKLANNAYC